MAAAEVPSFAPRWGSLKNERGNIHELHHPGHVRAFQALRSPLYDNITLASCLINGEPGVAIVKIDEAGEGKIAVMPPLRCNHVEHGLGLSRRARFIRRWRRPKNPREAFELNKALTSPAPHWTRSGPAFPARMPSAGLSLRTTISPSLNHLTMARTICLDL